MVEITTVEDIAGWDEDLQALTDGVGWLFNRPEPRVTFGLTVRALLSDVAKKNSWGLAEHVGLPHPAAVRAPAGRGTDQPLSAPRRPTTPKISECSTRMIVPAWRPQPSPFWWHPDATQRSRGGRCLRANIPPLDDGRSRWTPGRLLKRSLVSPASASRRGSPSWRVQPPCMPTPPRHSRTRQRRRWPRSKASAARASCAPTSA